MPKAFFLTSYPFITNISIPPAIERVLSRGPNHCHGPHRTEERQVGPAGLPRASIHRQRPHLHIGPVLPGDRRAQLAERHDQGALFCCYYRQRLSPPYILAKNLPVSAWLKPISAGSYTFPFRFFL